MSSVHLGFIGFGEVASILSKPMKESGADVFAYDVVLEQENGHDTLHERDQVGGITFCSLLDLVKHADYILSTVTSGAAIEVAENCVGYLKPGKTYVDLNSTAPAVKVEIANIIDPTGADFVEGAILGAVGVSGANTRILTAGKKGKQTAEAFAQWGLNASYYGPEIGKASMFKMLRSIFSKGLEALALELLVAGKRAGIQTHASDQSWRHTGRLGRGPQRRLWINRGGDQRLAHGGATAKMPQRWASGDLAGFERPVAEMRWLTRLCSEDQNWRPSDVWQWCG